MLHKFPALLWVGNKLANSFHPAPFVSCALFVACATCAAGAPCVSCAPFAACAPCAPCVSCAPFVACAPCARSVPHSLRQCVRHREGCHGGSAVWFCLFVSFLSELVQSVEISLECVIIMMQI